MAKAVSKNGKLSKVQHLAITGITAAVYATLTFALSFMSYGQFQCRIAEVMNLLVFINPAFAPGIILGCFIANLGSPMLLLDLLFGVPATALSLFLISRSKNLFVASLHPVWISFFAIGLELAITLQMDTGGAFNLLTFLTSFVVNGAWVAAGEFVASSIIGFSIFKFFIIKNEKLVNLIKFK